MITPVIRGRGNRNRAMSGRLVRTRPVGRKRIPPVPWIGEISRYLYPTAITDYESVQDAAWSTANLKDTFNGATASPQFGGTEYSCYYHVVTVSDESTDDVEVIMQPIRYSLDMAAATNDDFDYWREGTTSPVAPQWFDVNGNQPLSSEGYLPVSGNSHVSDGKPTHMYLKDILDFGGWLHCWRLYGGWNPTISLTPLPICRNWEVTPRYIRVRQNGTPVGGLFDFEDYWDLARQAQYFPWVTGGLLSKLLTTYTLYYPSSQLAGSVPDLTQAYELDITAGDTLEIDVWYQLRSRPLYNRGVVVQTSQSRNIVACLSRHVTSSSERKKTSDRERFNGALITTLHKACVLGGFKIANGWDPSAHTVTLQNTGGTWNWGDGTAGAKKAEAGSGWNAPVITSQGITWTGVLAGTGSGGITFNATYTPLGGGFERLDFEALTVTNGGTISFAFAGGGATFNYTSTTTSAATFIADLETAMNSFISAQGSDGYWSTATATAFGTTLTVDYSDAIGDLVPTSGSGGPLGGRSISMFLVWTGEIATLQVDVVGSPAKSWRFRPQDSSDYITQVTDRAEGSLKSSPCGVYNHLGTTTFLPWFGTRDSADSDPTDTDRPTSITVVKVNQ